MATGALTDDPNILDEEALYRRIYNDSRNMIAVDTVTGDRRPSSGAFKPDEDGVSVYRASKLRHVGLGPKDVTTAPSNLVVSVSVGSVRTLQPLGVADDTWPQGVPNPDHPRNGAHALIVGWSGLSTNVRRRYQKKLAELAAFVYPEPSP